MNNDGGATRNFDAASVSSGGTQGDMRPDPKKDRGGKKQKGAANKKSVTRRIFGAIGGTFKTVLILLLTIFLIAVITGVILASMFVLFVKTNFIDPAEGYDIVGLDTNLEQTSKIYYSDSVTGAAVELEDQRLHGDENRSWVSIGQMPQNLKNAFVAIEDQRFYQHNGMDLRRTGGAILEFVKGNSSYGGSTITQQLIKNFSGDDDATVQRKITEIFRAISLTKKRSKDEVLEMYLNTINLSNGCYGVQAAANYLFGKDVGELTLVECASLAAIPKSPYKYNPKTNPEENKERRDTVLMKMDELNWISEEEYKAALDAELVLNITEKEDEDVGSDSVYSYFTDALIEQVIADLMAEYGYPYEAAKNIVFNGGLKIYTTVDPEIQAIMEDVYINDTTVFPQVDGVQPESAMVVMDPYTGDVKGIVGGRGEKLISRGLNRATQSKRQVGSSIKPVTVYAPAIDSGEIDFGTTVVDTPYSYNEKTEKFWPDNAGRGYIGNTSVYDAVIRSLNTPAVKVLETISPEYSFYLGKEYLGLHSLLESDNDYAPLALGGLTTGLTVMEMAGAYTVFPGEGTYAEPRLYTKIYNNEGELLLSRDNNKTVVFSRSTAQIMNKILAGVVSGTPGTGAAVTLDTRVATAGKTGSTNSNKDFYFVGYTPYYVGAAWYGYDIPKYISTSTNYAMYAWDKVMNRIHDEVIAEANASGTALKSFSDDLIVKAEYCIDSGKKPTILCTAFDPRGSRVAEGWYKKGTEPREECDCHVMIDFCGTTNAVAGEYCPEEGRSQFALVNVDDRDFFPKDIIVVDTQYTCRTTPEDFVPSDNPALPYYASLAPEGMYTGRTKVDYQFNRACTDHLSPPEEPIEPEDPVNDDDDDGTEMSTENSGEDLMIPPTDVGAGNADNIGSDETDGDRDNRDNDETSPENENNDDVAESDASDGDNGTVVDGAAVPVIGTDDGADVQTESENASSQSSEVTPDVSSDNVVNEDVPAASI